jgi:hypothetical protein
MSYFRSPSDSDLHLYLNLACSRRPLRDDDLSGDRLKIIFRGFEIIGSRSNFRDFESAARVRDDPTNLSGIIANLKNDIRAWLAIDKKDCAAFDGTDMKRYVEFDHDMLDVSPCESLIWTRVESL